MLSDQLSTLSHPHCMRVVPLLTRRYPDQVQVAEIAAFLGRDAPMMDFVCAVCDEATTENRCGRPGQPLCVQWSMQDPAQSGAWQAVRAVCRATCQSIRTRAALPIKALSRAQIQTQARAIDRIPETP